MAHSSLLIQGIVYEELASLLATGGVFNVLPPWEDIDTKDPKLAIAPWLQVFVGQVEYSRINSLAVATVIQAIHFRIHIHSGVQIPIPPSGQPSAQLGYTSIFRKLIDGYTIVANPGDEANITCPPTWLTADEPQWSKQGGMKADLRGLYFFT